MIVIFNSDVLYADYHVRNRLPPHLDKFLSACAFNGVRILVPETTLYEFRHNQQDKVRNEQAQLIAAIRRLESWGITFDHPSPESLILCQDLMTMVSQTGVDFDILHPTLEDYKSAHFRACFHESPIPPDSESDEMRDLVIWIAAIRIAQENGGAILLSRDKVHTHARGNDEADQAGLKRFKGVDDALAYLGAESPAAKPVRELLARAWSEFETHGFPVREMPLELSILESKFVRGDNGIEELIEARISIRETPQRKVEFRIRATPLDPQRENVEVWDILDNTGDSVCKPFSVPIVRPAERIAVQEQLAALRRIIQG